MLSLDPRQLEPPMLELDKHEMKEISPIQFTSQIVSFVSFISRILIILLELRDNVPRTDTTVSQPRTQSRTIFARFIPPYSVLVPNQFVQIRECH